MVATYNRPDVLPVALRSALAQRPGVAEVIVVGDACDARTADAIASIGDGRVRYVNLPRRFGEQSGPNSVGMRLARTPFLALLNQDDVWLPGHIAAGLRALEAGGDFFLGRAARASAVALDGRPVFTRAHAPQRRPRDGFGANWEVEPASAWVFRAELVERVGPWTPARQLHRPPIQDWYLRAWRSGGSIVFGRELTVLKMTTHYANPSDRPAYLAPSPEHGVLERWLAETDPADVIAEVVAEATRSGGYRVRIGTQFAAQGPVQAASWLARTTVRLAVRPLLKNLITAGAYRATGFDAYAAALRLARRVPGTGLDRGAIRRTGRPLPEPPDLDDLMAAIGAEDAP